MVVVLLSLSLKLFICHLASTVRHTPPSPSSSSVRQLLNHPLHRHHLQKMSSSSSFSSTSTSASAATISSSPLLHDFLQLVEARKGHAKSVLKQQVDAILEDFFSQLVAEFREQMMKVVAAAASCECTPPLSKVESVICEPTIEMCLIEEVGREEEKSMNSQQQQQQQERANSSATAVQNVQAKAAKSSPRNSKLAQSKSARKAASPSEVMKIEVDSESDDQKLNEEEKEEDMSNSILGRSLKENFHHHQQQRQTFHTGQMATTSHIFEMHQVSAATVSELQLGEQSPPPPLQPPPPLPAAAVPSPTGDSNSPWICSTCGKKMKNERTLYMHQWRYHKGGEFRCQNCSFIASYRIQLRTHQIRFHDLGKFSCPFPGCGRSFNRRNSLKRHERIHLRLKPYRCKMCDYASELRSSMIDHVRVLHWRLPRSRKEQLEMSIGDDRDPADYFEVIQEGLDMLEPVLEHVHTVLAATAMARDDGGGGGDRGGDGDDGQTKKTKTEDDDLKRLTNSTSVRRGRPTLPTAQ